MDALLEVRRRWLLVVTVAVAAAGATAAFSFTAAKHYRATAVVVVQPTPPSDLLGLNVLHDTSRRTAAATAARLVRDAAVAQRVSDRLGLGSSGAALLRKVQTDVARGTDAVEVTVTDTSPARAAQIANGLVDGFLADRAVTFGSQVHSAIAKLRNRLAALAPADRAGAQGAALVAAIAGLQRWVGFADPTVAHGPAAVEPRSAAWPHPFRWTLYGGLIGLVAGLLAALALGFAASVRRRALVDSTEYDRPVADRSRPFTDKDADRLAERLERRLAGRVAELGETEARLAGREAALETREREVKAKLEELRAAAAAPAHGGDDTAAEELRGREQELAARAEALERRERAVEARAADLQQLEARIDAQRQALEAPPPAAAPAPAEAPAPAPAPAATTPAAEAAPAAAPNGGWRLAELERLVESHAAQRPDRAEEWRSYLFYLRDYVDEAGRVPSHFDWLIEDTFGELLVQR